MKCRMMFVLALLMSVSFAAFAQSPSDKLFRDLESQISHAVVTKDASAMDKLFANDYTSVSVSGHVRTRAEIIGAYSHGTISIKTSRPENMTVRQYRDFAIVIGVVTVSGVDGTTDISGKYTFTRIYKRDSGAWRAVSFQATPVK
jgi:ketosteroid isomerase-like protein